MQNELEALVRDIRRALGNLAVEIDAGQFPPNLRPSENLPDTDTLRRLMPELDPSLSTTIIDGREDRL
jgi:hypothetical protein